MWMYVRTTKSKLFHRRTESKLDIMKDKNGISLVVVHKHWLG